MNSRERFVGALTGAKIDRVPFIVVFGGANAVVPEWEAKDPGLSGRIDAMLKFEGAHRGWQNTWVNTFLSGEPDPVTVEEDEEKKIIRTGCGGLKLIKKQGDFHSATLEYPVKNRKEWENVKARFLDPKDESRFPKNWEEKCGEYNKRDYALGLNLDGVYNTARMLMGDEGLSYAFYDDPELVTEIMGTVTDRVIKIWEKICKGVKQLDLVESWEA
ncbi:MAG: hypothetical protein WCI43_02820, partial [Candidatus Firestonebacteria bacterium]